MKRTFLRLERILAAGCVQPFDQFLYAFNITAIFKRKFNVKFLCDYFRERDEIYGGNSGLLEADVQIIGQRNWLPIDFQIFRDEVSDTVCS